MTPETHNSALFAIVLTTLAFGCTQDEVGTFDAANGTDMGPSGEVGTDADAGDIARDADGGGDTTPDADGGSMDETKLDIDAPVVPDEPAATTHCNDDGWCWLHPAPFPHRITDLQRVGDRVFGVASAYELQGQQPVLWDGTSMMLLPKPTPPGELLPDMTTSDDGWLALQENSTVLDVGPEGVRSSRQVSGSGYRSISGNSSESFLVRGGDDVQTLVIQEDRELSEALPEDISFGSNMMPSGAIWGVTDLGDYTELLDGTWRIFPAPDVLEEYTSMGPDPGSECSSEGIFLGSNEGDFYRWDDIGGGFARPSYDGPGITSIGCSPSGDLFLTDRQGRMLTRTGRAAQPWERLEVLDRRIESTATAGSDVYVSGADGEHAVVSGEQVTRLRGGFTVPRAQLPEEPYNRYTAMWVDDDGEEIILSHTSGTYRGTASGWTRTPIAAGETSSQVMFQRILESKGTRYAITSRRLWRFDGSSWIDITREAFGEETYNHDQILVGPDDNLWVVGSLDLYRYDGQEWTNLLDEGTPFEESLDASDLYVRELFEGRDGELIVSTGEATHTLAKKMGEWSLTKRLDLTCDTQDAYYEGADGSVWTVDELSGCVARHIDGTWTTYQLPPREQRPPDDLGPERVGWLEQPGSNVPLLGHPYGVLEPQPDGTLKPEFVGHVVDEYYVSAKDAHLVLTPRGVIAKHYQ